MGIGGKETSYGVPIMLNDTLIRSLKPAEKPRKHFDGGGMYLLVTATGSKLWRMVYRRRISAGMDLKKFREFSLIDR